MSHRTDAFWYKKCCILLADKTAWRDWAKFVIKCTNKQCNKKCQKKVHSNYAAHFIKRFVFRKLAELLNTQFRMYTLFFTYIAIPKRKEKNSFFTNVFMQHVMQFVLLFCAVLFLNDSSFRRKVLVHSIVLQFMHWCHRFHHLSMQI